MARQPRTTRQDDGPTLTDQWLRRLRNNPIVAALLVVGISIIALSTFWHALPGQIQKIVDGFFSGPSPPSGNGSRTSASRAQTSLSQSQLVSDMYLHPGCVPMRLDRTTPSIPEEIKPGVVSYAEKTISKSASGTVMLIGIGVEGTPSYAIGVGLRRADAVAELLASHGIDRTKIIMRGVTTSAPLGRVIPIGDGLFCGVWIQKN
jgi:hypothetical protein